MCFATSRRKLTRRGRRPGSSPWGRTSSGSGRPLAIPVIAAGGIMDGAGIAAVLRLGASAAQLGTAFIATDESDADAGYRDALASDAANHTVMTRAISGRPARCLQNRFTMLGANIPPRQIP